MSKSPLKTIVGKTIKECRWVSDGINAGLDLAFTDGTAFALNVSQPHWPKIDVSFFEDDNSDEKAYHRLPVKER